MPKIIENARGLLIDEAKKQIDENGYSGVTIRSIAKGCNLGLGTFYNYFKSKDMLIATFLLEDWQGRVNKVTVDSEGTSDPMDIVKAIYDEITDFAQANKNIFESAEAKKSFNNTVGMYHKTLRKQIAEPIYKCCFDNGYENAVFLSEFVAESILTWTVAKKGYNELSSILSKLFVK